MKKVKYSFTVMEEYVSYVIEENVEPLKLEVVAEESDFPNGKITVVGSAKKINTLKSFFSGEYSM